MKNITVSVDDERYRRARVHAARAGRSVSALVRDFIDSLDAEEKNKALRDEMNQLFAELDASGGGLKSGKNLSRDELYAERFKH